MMGCGRPTLREDDGIGLGRIKKHFVPMMAYDADNGFGSFTDPNMKTKLHRRISSSFDNFYPMHHDLSIAQDF